MPTRVLPRLPLLLRPLIARSTTPLLPLTGPSRAFYVPISRPLRIFSSSSPSFSQSPTPSTPPAGSSTPSLSQRLKHLIKFYGWYALGVYLIVGVLDFGVAFAGISLFGAEHISRFVAAVKGAVIGFIQDKPPEPGREERETMQQPHSGSEGLYAMLALAYTIHKTIFMPLRIGVTAAFTPKLVEWLSKKGWTGREGTRRAAEEMKERLRNRTRD